MKKSAFASQLLVISFLLLSGCGGSPSAQVVELSNNTVSYDEPIHINNCGGKADSEQTASRSFATNIEGGAEFSAGYQSIVEGSISAKYSQYRNVTKSQKLIAPPGTNMEFVLRWSEEVHAGNVTVNGATGNYEVRVPVAVEQVSSQDLDGCDGNVSTNPTSLPTAIQQPPQTNFSDITVSANANNGVQFIAPTSGNYQFRLKEGTYCTPSICRSIIHGYLGRDVVWKDFYGLPHPMEQDYELGCWEDPTASNPNCAVGMSVTVYMNAQQYMRWIIMEDKNAFADNRGAVILSVTLNP
jgi:hypothetical protein